MTFPRDKTEGKFQAEDHSPLSVVMVSVAMIAVALGSVSAIL